jgi:hypothetical protein
MKTKKENRLGVVFLASHPYLPAGSPPRRVGAVEV